MLSILKKLVSINSENPPCDCIAILKYVRDFLKKNTKAKIVLQPVAKTKGNVIAIFGKPQILLNAHLDTVPASGFWKRDPLKLTRVKNRVYGLGTTDVKGAVAAILSAIKVQSPQNTMLLFSSDEEHGNMECISTFVKSGYTRGIKYGIVTEPTDLNIVTRHKGVYTFEITFFGKSAHSAKPERGTNAIELAAKFISGLSDYEIRLAQRRYRDMKKSTLNVGIINGGVKSTIVPDECRIVVDRRVLPGKDRYSAPYELKRLLRKYDKKAKMKTTYNVPCLKTDRKIPPVHILKICGAKQLESVVDFWTEAPLFSEAGIPAVVFGPGTITQAHTANEFIAIRDLEKARKIYTKLFSII